MTQSKDFAIYKPNKSNTGACLGVRLQRFWVDDKDPKNIKYNIGSVKLTITMQSAKDAFKGEQIKNFKLNTDELSKLIIGFKNKSKESKYLHTYTDDNTKLDVVTTLTTTYSDLGNGKIYYGLTMNQKNGDVNKTVRISLTPSEVYSLIVLFESAIPAIWGWN